MGKGKLIVVEGACDGIGKSTQYKLLKERLENDGFIVTNHHFPSYGEYQAAPVEKYLHGDFGKPSDNDPEIINDLYAIDRFVTWNEKLKPKYEEGNIILLDRYTTSSLIYQSALINNEEDKIKFINYVTEKEYKKYGIKEPDQVIFLNAPFDLVTNLRNKRKENDGISNDIHEQDIEFMKKVYESALFVAKYLKWDNINCNNSDEMRTIEEIHNEIYGLVRKRM
jgi:dTMP kinase